MIAVIPARAGSKRIPGKNLKRLGHRPLLDWTICAALSSGVFARIVVSTNDGATANTANIAAGAIIAWFRRTDGGDGEADIAWLHDVLSELPEHREFCILRPTSPFRTADTIRRAYRQWQDTKDCLDSLRAVRLASETPYKMWVSAAPSPAFRDSYPMTAVLSATQSDGTPYHSSPTQTLPTVYVQTGALEMGWTRNVEQLGTISGRKVGLFYTDGPDALDLNTPDDWARAEALLAADPALRQTPSLAGVPAAPQAQ